MHRRAASARGLRELYQIDLPGDKEFQFPKALLDFLVVFVRPSRTVECPQRSSLPCGPTSRVHSALRADWERARGNAPASCVRRLILPRLDIVSSSHAM